MNFSSSKFGLMFAAGAMAAAAAVAAPSVSNIVMTRVNDGSEQQGTIRIAYTLANGPAIITADLFTNGVSTAGIGVKRVSGDVNRIVKGNGTHYLYWQAGGDDWPAGGVALADTRFTVNAWDVNDPPAYLAMNCSVTNVFRFYQYPDAFPRPDGVRDTIYKTEWLVMRKIPAKGVVWKMGKNAIDTSTTDAGRSTPHLVEFTGNYYVSIYTVTRRQAYYFGSGDNSVNSTNSYPYTGASIDTMRGSYANGYLWPTDRRVRGDSICGRMRTFSGIDFDLTTDAQWEYACRAGVPQAYNCGLNSIPATGEVTELDDYAWVNASAVMPVGLKKPNQWGIYDMHGNVWERCLDWAQTTLSDATGANADPVGPVPISFASGTATVYKNGVSGDTENVGRVIRGSEFQRVKTAGGGQVRSAHRNWQPENWSASNCGYRLACPCPAVTE